MLLTAESRIKHSGMRACKMHITQKCFINHQYFNINMCVVCGATMDATDERNILGSSLTINVYDGNDSNHRMMEIHYKLNTMQKV